MKGYSCLFGYIACKEMCNFCILICHYYMEGCVVKEKPKKERGVKNVRIAAVGGVETKEHAEIKCMLQKGYRCFHSVSGELSFCLSS